MKREKTNHRTDNGKPADMKVAAEKAFSAQRRDLYLSQALEMISSDSASDKAKAGKTLLRLALEGSARAEEAVISYCSEKIGSGKKRERKGAREFLIRLATKRDSEKAKSILVADHQQAIEDFHMRAMLYLGMNANESVSRKIDMALEECFERLEKGRDFEAIAYVAGMSSCSLKTKMRAATLAASTERRRSSLKYIHDATDEPAIKNVMKEALTRMTLSVN
jgi:hypothetical protein